MILKRIKTDIGTMIGENCYIIQDDETKETMIIDPGNLTEELAEIISRAKINSSEKLGVCLDTCHVYSAGYDIVNHLDEVLEEFDKIIGLDRLQAIHLNDSMTEFNSHKDRHECLGKGSLGADAIINFINHPSLRGIPINLETPNELEGYAQEIALLRNNYKE